MGLRMPPFHPRYLGEVARPPNPPVGLLRRLGLIRAARCEPRAPQASQPSLRNGPAPVGSSPNGLEGEGSSVPLFHSFISILHNSKQTSSPARTPRNLAIVSGAVPVGTRGAGWPALPSASPGTAGALAAEMSGSGKQGCRGWSLRSRSWETQWELLFSCRETAQSPPTAR